MSTKFKVEDKAYLIYGKASKEPVIVTHIHEKPGHVQWYMVKFESKAYPYYLSYAAEEWLSPR